MTKVKPWEPVSVRFEDDVWKGMKWDWEIDGCWEDMTEKAVKDWSSQGLHANVTLANSQRVIVRALSEERKAARAMQKRVNRAVEANHSMAQFDWRSDQ